MPTSHKLQLAKPEMFQQSVPLTTGDGPYRNVSLSMISMMGMATVRESLYTRASSGSNHSVFTSQWLSRNTRTCRNGEVQVVIFFRFIQKHPSQSKVENDCNLRLQNTFSAPHVLFLLLVSGWEVGPDQRERERIGSDGKADNFFWNQKLLPPSENFNDNRVRCERRENSLFGTTELTCKKTKCASFSHLARRVVGSDDSGSDQTLPLCGSHQLHFWQIVIQVVLQVTPQMICTNAKYLILQRFLCQQVGCAAWKRADSDQNWSN